MDKLINILNSFNMVGKVLIIVLVVLVILLIVLSIIFALRKDDNIINKEVDLDFFDELKKKNDGCINTSTEKESKEEPIQKQENINGKMDLQSISNQMEKDIEKNNIELTEFELEQEEKAIISYNELINKVKQNELNNVNVQTVDLDDRGYNLEPEFSYDTEILDFSDLLENENKLKFKASEFISPVDGIQSPTTEMIKKTDIKSILDLDEVNETTYTNTEFLSALKDLRDSLQ